MDRSMGKSPVVWGRGYETEKAGPLARTPPF